MRFVVFVIAAARPAVEDVVGRKVNQGRARLAARQRQIANGQRIYLEGRERFSFRGKYWQFDDIIVEPPTNQKPHPPFWQGAGHQNSIARVAKRGHNLLVDQFCPIETAAERVAIYKSEMAKNGF